MLVGLVGAPNTGKSTFFKAATLAEVEIADRPFVTIKANRGFGFVKIKCVEQEFNIKCNPRFGYCLDGWRFVPIELLDVAGLIPGAHKGLGLGNKFLDDLRQADAFIHIIDVSGSTNEKGEPVEPGSYDPANDIRFLEDEIDMWFFGLLKKSWEQFSRQVSQEKKEAYKEIAKEFSGLKIDEDGVKAVLKTTALEQKDPKEWNDYDLKNFATQLRKTTKPMIIAANKIDVAGADKLFENLVKQFPDYLIVPCSAESELALREAAKHELIEYIPGENDFKIKGELNGKQKTALEFVKKNILEKYGSTGVQQVLDKAVFELLKQIAVYPVPNAKMTDKEGRILPDCYLVPEGITALDFAFKIHTDIGNAFIRAIDIRTKQVIGKEHKLKNNDVIEIVTSR